MPRFGNSRLPLVFGTLAFSCTLALVAAPSRAYSDGGTFRIDPEALSGRIAQYLLGEPESQTGTSTGGVTFGPNIRLSDEHIARRLISQTEPSIAMAPNGSDAVAGFHDLLPR